MPVNPATKPEHIKSPITRANDLNDPQFQNQEGYYPYDLTHQELLTPLFGKITPCCHFITAPADRHLVKNNIKTILNRVDGNLLSTLNQYVDSFYVPFRSVYPTNFEKLLPNPSKGSDLPNSALPMVNFASFVYSFLHSEAYIEAESEQATINDTMTLNVQSPFIQHIGIARWIFLATILSRGQLLDYLGLGFDLSVTDMRGISILQTRIDTFFDKLFAGWQDAGSNRIYRLPLDSLNSDIYDFSELEYYDIADGNRSLFRAAIDDILEKGSLPLIGEPYLAIFDSSLILDLLNALEEIFADNQVLFEITTQDFIEYVDSDSSPFANGGWLNLGLILAYQQCVAQYFTNDSVDNIFNSDLYMQNLRSVMFPSESIYTTEPVFRYNGVATEYDYISGAAFHNAVVSSENAGLSKRQVAYMSLMFLLRRSLRYGDYFSTARPRMLAVGDLSINAVDGMVSPIDVTQNLLKQRYLNAVNYTGSGFLQYYASQFGVTPSDTATFPRFLSHQKLVLQNQLTNNTADEQGKQTTNIVGYADSNFGFDVFIDDIGYIIQVTSYDVLPVYTSGIDSSYHLADRFDFFNPMLQNIGDQPIRLSEMIGYPADYEKVFGYTMRNAEYKYKLSKAHGAFVNNDLAGFLVKYPFADFVRSMQDDDTYSLTISPDFIRDRSYYLDNTIPALTGVSPAQYFHFVSAFNNEVHSARKIQKTPPILF